MSDALSCGAVSWSELAGNEAELLPARTVLSCYGGSHGNGDGGNGDGDGGNLNLNENTNTNTATATATASLLPETGLLGGLLG